MQSSSSAIAFSPSFNSYSSGTLADIAARVIEEFRAESVISNKDYDDDGMFNFTPKQDLDESRILTDKEMKQGKEANDNDADDDDEEEFEFAFVCRDPDLSSISADEIFYNGQIKPVFPLFDTSLLLEDGADIIGGSNNSKPPVRLSLSKLFHRSALVLVFRGRRARRRFTENLLRLEAKDDAGGRVVWQM